MASILILGLFINSTLISEITPVVEADAVHINIYSPGSSSQEIEQDIIIPLEDIIQSFDIKVRYKSFANDSYGKIVATIPVDSNLKNNRQRLIQRLHNVNSIPANAQITITEEGAHSIPKYYFMLYTKDGFSNNTMILQETAREIIDELSQINNINGIESSGIREKEIHIDINPKALKKNYISLYEIIRSIRTRNINSASGTIETENQEKILITDAAFPAPLDITNTILRSNFEKRSISVNDIADTKISFANATHDVYINGKQGVFFGVKSKNNVDIKKLTKKIDQFISNKTLTLPKELGLQIIDRRADAINITLDMTIASIWVGIIMVFLILLLFLDWRTAFWTTMTIPTTIAGLIILLKYLNISMNIITLVGIITVLGMLVDHGIIISENIFSYKEKGMDSSEAVRHGINDVLLPIFITVITTIVAFIPLLLIGGTIGDLIRSLPIVICLALILSFIDALLFLPAHLAFIPNSAIRNTEKPWFIKIKKIYTILLEKALRMRYLVLLIFIGILAGTVVLADNMFKGFVFIEPIAVNSIYINFEAAGGINRSEMKHFVENITTLVKEAIPEHERTAIKEEIGRYHILALSSRGFAANRGQIGVFLSPTSQRTRNFEEILDSVKKKIEASPEKTNFTRIFYDSFGLIPKTATALNMRFLQKLNSNSSNHIIAMQEVYEYIKQLDGVVNPEHSLLTGKTKLMVQFDYIKMAQLGIDAQTVSDILKIAANGLNATTWRSNREKIPYIVRLSPDYKNDLSEINDLQIPNVFSRLIPLKEFTKIYEKEGSEDILRSSGKRMVEIDLDIDPKKTNPTLISKKILNFYNTIKHKYPDVDIETSGESVSIANAFADFKLAFCISILLIYIILLLLFKEPLQPFIVLVSIPFGIIGAMWAFYFHNQVLSFMSLVGIVGLSGIVVNDAVVMVDFINKVALSNSNNKDIMTSIIEGAQNRFKAVVLTTMTTVLGLLPSIYGLKDVADLIIPTTTAIAYGLLFATLLTLFLIPILYLIGYDIKNFRIKK